MYVYVYVYVWVWVCVYVCLRMLLCVVVCVFLQCDAFTGHTAALREPFNRQQQRSFHYLKHGHSFIASHTPDRIVQELRLLQLRGERCFFQYAQHRGMTLPCSNVPGSKTVSYGRPGLLQEEGVIRQQGCNCLMVTLCV